MKIAIFGHTQMVGLLLDAVRSEGLDVLDTNGVEICDEWQTRNWFATVQPKLVLIGMLGQPELTSRELLLNTQGLINVVNASIGITDRVQVISWFASNSYFLIRHLCQLCASERGVHFASQLAIGKAAVANACVLVMRDALRLSTESSKEEGTKGESQGIEVRDQAMSEQARHEQYRVHALSLLEMPKSFAQRASSGDLRAQRYSATGQG